MLLRDDEPGTLQPEHDGLAKLLDACQARSQAVAEGPDVYRPPNMAWADAADTALANAISRV